MENYLIDVDSYKVSHSVQYPPHTTSMFSYVESRGGPFESTVFFGLQYYLKKYLTHRVTVEEVEEAKEFFDAHGEPFNYEGWMYVAKDLGGKLPVRIRAPKEGSLIETHNILVSVESTDPKAFWVVSWLETMLLRIWYPITVATNSYFMKKLVMSYLEQSSDDPSAEISFKINDFGARGCSSQESAAIGGAAHLVNFLGSDTVAGIRMANKFYNCKMAGFSIPAAEHSSITSWGKDHEEDAYRNMLKQFAKPGSMLAVVSDSYDIINACENLWGDKLKQEVIDSGATVVIRPDSGIPKDIVLQVVQSLDKKFGHTVNSKGYKVLNNIRVIQGDGINYDSIKDILDNLVSHKYSATNIAFGMGGALLQAPNRDTFKFAMKCSSITVDGKTREVFKDPVTDPGKRSKAGRLDLVDVFGLYQTSVLGDKEAHTNSVMQTVYLNGEVLVNDSMDEIRKRLSEQK